LIRDLLTTKRLSDYLRENRRRKAEGEKEGKRTVNILIHLPNCLITFTVLKLWDPPFT
jgi:hypothetical protein